MLTYRCPALERTPIEMLAVPAAADVDLHSAGPLRKIIATAKTVDQFSAAQNQHVVLYQPAALPIARCLVAGLGAQAGIDAESLRRFAAQAVKSASAAKCTRLGIAVPLTADLPLPTTAVIKALLEGAFLSNHTFDKYKTNPAAPALKEIFLLLPTNVAKQHQSLIDEVTAVCGGTLHAREWVNTPPNAKTPQQFAAAVKAAAGKQIKVSILSEAQLRQRKFGALLAVAAGSANPPCLVEMVYQPPHPKGTIALVGKGVTFDTGGINLKPSTNLEAMKSDMAGAAAVAATLIAMGRLQPDRRIVGILPLVENMPSGRAARPSDIVFSLSGKSVEIGNTDAEGRLILADALHYTCRKYKPDVLVDLATLTGACVVALGNGLAGLFCADDALAAALSAAGRSVHERCWRLPLPKDYKELLKSEWADISNMPSAREGAAITAALFLSEFVGDGPWAHIDIAGTAFTKKASDYCPMGGSGFGVRLLCEWILRHSDNGGLKSQSKTP